MSRIVRVAIQARRAAGILLLIIGATASTAAQESALTWKLKAGDNFPVTREQQTVSHTSVANKPVRTSVETSVTMTWNVDEVDDQNIATITQSLDNIAVKLDAGNGIIAFDSSVTQKPSGPVKTLADGVLPLVGEKFVVTMTPRGTISSVKLSEKLTKLLAGKKDKPDEEAFSSEGVVRLLQQPLVLLPKSPVAAGASWETERNLPSGLGTLKQTLTYTFAGFGEGERSKIARIDITGEIAPPPAAAGAPKLKANEFSGTAQFDTEAGRLVEMTAKQTLELTTIYANTPLSVKTESKLSTRLAK